MKRIEEMIEISRKSKTKDERNQEQKPKQTDSE
jgi:hypothetical protein